MHNFHACLIKYRNHNPELHKMNDLTTGIKLYILPICKVGKTLQCKVQNFIEMGNKRQVVN